MDDVCEAWVPSDFAVMVRELSCSELLGQLPVAAEWCLEHRGGASKRHVPHLPRHCPHCRVRIILFQGA